MKRISTYYLLLLVLISLGCNNTGSSDFFEPAPAINTSLLNVDQENRLVIYNGNHTSLKDGALILDDYAYSLATGDDELILGKEYSLMINDSSYRFFYTELPVVSIDSLEGEIVDEPKIRGSITIVQKNEGVQQYDMGIELRGGVSQTYPKKSYGIELKKNSQSFEELKVSLLNMRTDGDWILDGLWNEPIRIRDYTSHEIWLEITGEDSDNSESQMGIDREYCELFVNGSYRGLYYLGERIDRKQLDLEKYDGQLGGELYKGVSWGWGVTFFGLQDYDNQKQIWSGYEAEYPDEIGELNWNNLHHLVSLVVNSDKADFDELISTQIDIDNAIDYFLFVNTIFATDNIGKNTFTAKNNANSGYYFLPWDMDGSFGNDWEGLRTDITDSVITHRLFDRLLDSPDVVSKVKTRWSDLRSNSFRSDVLKNKFRSNYTYLEQNGVYLREALIAGISNGYTSSEIEFIESWIDRRLSFLDSYVESL